MNMFDIVLAIVLAHLILDILHGLFGPEKLTVYLQKEDEDDK